MVITLPILSDALIKACLLFSIIQNADWDVAYLLEITQNRRFGLLGICGNEHSVYIFHPHPHSHPPINIRLSSQHKHTPFSTWVSLFIWRTIIRICSCEAAHKSWLTQ